nr:MAG TPA: hypothetical protein [Caudoviricetes sp.]
MPYRCSLFAFIDIIKTPTVLSDGRGLLLKIINYQIITKNLNQI